MSSVEVNSVGDLHPHHNELNDSALNEQTFCLYNKTKSVQYPNEYESSSHTPKGNRKEAYYCDIEVDEHPSKLGQSKQEAAKPASETTTTTSYFNTNHQSKIKSNDSSTWFHREVPRQTFPPFRITLHDNNRYPTTELSVIK
ncbi:unnamed protein product [Rotaria magnacalcarata]|uniref:Uncharacterized protein n=2 Tax=Rotaria magnacalcarata TaxID=392030 RepID=A0A817ANE1_9BILA|nr:unnamed protein product [Rotaria magnacalcarata]CAF4136469.1 unnamed protein product [Rotaria magnacalcarata]